MKLLFENWRDYLNEREQVDVSPEENQALKGLYLKIRSILHHFAEWLQQNNYSPSEVTHDMIIQNYKPPSEFEGPSKGWGEITFDVSEFKSVLPNLADKFYVVISDEVDGFGELKKDGDGIIEGISLNSGNFENLSKIKQTTQHELQHILDFGADKGEGAEGTIDYLSNEGEVRAHAKEAAYYVFKNSPDAEEVDFKEIAGEKKTFGNYYNFSTDPAAIVQRTGVEPSYEQKMKKAGDNFIKYANYFLNLYRNK